MFLFNYILERKGVPHMFIVQLLLAIALLGSSGSSNYATSTQLEINQSLLEKPSNNLMALFLCQ
ncbi:hypothetical protein J2X75_005134 [Paenibacillus sp. 2003]|nr:hypothetical protein [Paenibacillus sp. 2003]